MSRFAHYEAGAEQDLAEIYDYLDQRSESAADRFYDAVYEAVEQLLISPGRGGRYQCNNPGMEGVRIWRVNGFPNHLIFYRQQGNMLQILRVIHGARDYDAMFNK